MGLRFAAILLFVGQQASSGLADNSQDAVVFYEAETAPATISGRNSVYEFSNRQYHATALAGYLGGTSIEFLPLPATNTVVLYSVTAEQIAAIESLPGVLYVANNNPVNNSITKPKFADAKTARGLESNISNVGADSVWSQFSTKGEGIVIASADTGVQWDHPALKEVYRGYANGQVNHNYNWYDAVHSQISDEPTPCGYSAAEPCDGMGHGTHTVGTAVGNDGADNQIGMAPGAKWIGCRNMDWGDGRMSTYLECFQWVLAPFLPGDDPSIDGHPDLGADVMINSWACPEEEGCRGDEFLHALENLHRAGVMVVAAAGNWGNRCSTIDAQPATHGATTFSVGAYDHVTDRLAGFSSRGPSVFDGSQGPDITAPGVMIRSSIPRDSYAHMLFSGTSMAAPHVAGAVALLWSAVPELKNDVASSIDVLTGSAVAASGRQSCGGIAEDAVPNNSFGYGKLDVFSAVKKSLNKRYLVEFGNESSFRKASEAVDKLQKNGAFPLFKFDRVKQLWIINALSIPANRNSIDVIGLLKNVKRITVEHPKEFFFEPNGGLSTVSSSGVAWSMAQSKVDALWQKGITGEGITIAIIDGGFDVQHPDLAPQLWQNPNEIANGLDDDGNGLVDDMNGWDFVLDQAALGTSPSHGTHVAGIAVGNGSLGIKTGVSPKSKFLPLRVCCDLDAGSNEGFESDVWEGIQYIIEQHRLDPSISIISSSVGVAPWADPRRDLWRAVGEQLLDEGILLVNAAGNFFDLNPNNNIIAPASNPPAWLHPEWSQRGGTTSMISVGAVGSDLILMPYSSVGPTSWETDQYTDYRLDAGGLTKPDICAPSEVPSTYPANVGEHGYSNIFGGTSAAAPHVAGIAALLRSQFPLATVESVTEALLSTTEPYSNATVGNHCGTGIVNALKAWEFLSH